MTPSRTGRELCRNVMTRETINGSTNNAGKFGCAFACEIIEGANPQTTPPKAAARREFTRCRENTQYQAAEVPAKPKVNAITQVTVGPKVSVIGNNEIPTPNIAVLAIKFTPRG